MRKLIFTLILSALFFGCSDDDKGLSIEEQKAINELLLGKWESVNRHNSGGIWYFKFTDDFTYLGYWTIDDKIVPRGIQPDGSVYYYTITKDEDFIKLCSVDSPGWGCKYFKIIDNRLFDYRFGKDSEEKWIEEYKRTDKIF